MHANKTCDRGPKTPYLIQIKNDDLEFNRFNIHSSIYLTRLSPFALAHSPALPLSFLLFLCGLYMLSTFQTNKINLNGESFGREREQKNVKNKTQ